MAKKYVDGEYMELTAEELQEYEHAKYEELDDITPTQEERIAALEEQLVAAKILLGVE